MKGVILAGGMGTRLYPVTKVINKHLLPVYDRPMIMFPLETLAKAGIQEILIVLGGESVGDIIKLLGGGSDFGVRLTYKYQEEAGGIAQALALAEDFAGQDKIMVVLGDNILEDCLTDAVDDFLRTDVKAGIFLKEVSDPKRFGIAELDGQRVINIEEKPEEPKSNLAVTGVYMYDPEVFTVIRKIKPSGRGELEITDVNNYFIAQNSLTAYHLNGFWIDAGVFTSLHQASMLIQNKEGAHDD